MPEMIETSDKATGPPPDETAASHRQGTLGGIPYDTRRPTMARFKWTYWSAENTKLFPPKVSGLGWGVNFYWLFHLLRWFRVRKSPSQTA
jgi:hypothetical protein